jgi:uncharacterized damage-inducible protein DinB
MTPSELLKDAFTRVVESAERAVDGLSEDQLTARPAPDANTIAWLVWHLARGQDAQVSDVAGTEQVWTAQGYVDKFGLPFDGGATGYGQSSDEVGAVRAPADLLVDYLRAVHQQTLAFLDTVSEEDLDRVVDPRWDPPVTLGVRLVSVVNDDTQHVGQAAYVRGLLG